MNLVSTKKFAIVATIISIMGFDNLMAQCTFNNNQYPGYEIESPTTIGQTVQISTCSFGGEFASLTGFIYGGAYIVNISGFSPGYITVFNSSNVAVAFGNSPFTFKPTVSGNYKLQWSPDINCGSDASCHTPTVTLNSICMPVYSNMSVAACGQYTLGGTVYTSSGSYSHTFTAASALGCDSVVNLNLTIKNATTSSLTETACASYTLNGTTYTSSGIYTQNLTNGAGCDSTITLDLTINEPTSSSLTETACASYTLNGTTYTSSGIYTQTLTNAVSCDSTITLDLTINEPTSSSLTETACSSYTLNGTTYASSGIYTQNLTNAAGCDSTITLDLTINEPTSFSLTETACSSYTLNGTTYVSSGIYTQNLTNGAGCDSTITLDLTINEPTSFSLTETVCVSYTLNGTTYTSSGIYTQNLTNAAGCDSVITLDLTISDVTATLTQNGTTLTANVNGATYQWNDCASGNAIAGQTGQSFTAFANGSYSVTVTQDSCSAISTCATVTTVGMEEEIAPSPITLYPNPNDGQFTVHLGIVYDQANIGLYAMDGKLLLQKQVNNSDHVSLQINPVSGIYFVHVNRAGSISVIKFIIK